MLDIGRINLQATGINIKDIEAFKPIRPAILTLLTLKAKGCREWTRMLKHRVSVVEGVRDRELKWEQLLGARQSIRLWDAVDANQKLLSFDTRLKYFQFLVWRCQLHTNYIRNMYDPTVSPLCCAV